CSCRSAHRNRSSYTTKKWRPIRKISRQAVRRRARLEDGTPGVRPRSGRNGPDRDAPGSAMSGSGLTVIVPAYNEAGSIADTIRSIQAQTLTPEQIIVVDDCSTDATGTIARSCGVTVLRPPRNTGSKAGAQTFALSRVRTEFTMAVDADTVLAPDA